MSDSPESAGFRPITEQRLARIRDVLSRRHDDLVVVLEDIHDAHNASAILRSCDAFGIGRIALVYTDQVFPQISSGVAAKVEKWLQIDRYDSPEACVAALRADGLRIFATQLSDDAVDYRQIGFTQPTAIVLGNEHRGCSEAMSGLADANLIVPMVGFVQSLNVSVAAAVLMSEIARQRCESTPPWTPRKAAIEQQWIARESSRR